MDASFLLELASSPAAGSALTSFDLVLGRGDGTISAKTTKALTWEEESLLQCLQEGQRAVRDPCLRLSNKLFGRHQGVNQQRGRD